MPSLIGALMSVRALASTVIRPLMPLLVRRLGSRSRTALAAMTVAAVAFGLTGLGEQIVVLALLAAVLGLAVGVAQPLAMVVLADHVDPATGPPPSGSG